MNEFVALDEIGELEYRNLAQNGARILFDLGDYRVLDGVKDELSSYFLKDFNTDRWYLIDLKTCYELVTMYYCGGDKKYLEECLDNVVFSVK